MPHATRPPQLRPPRKHRWDRRKPPESLAPVPPIPPDPPVAVTASVNRTGLRTFVWYFDLPYATAGHESWVPADFSELIVEGRHPVAILNTSGEDGTLVLEYDFDPDPPTPLAWEVSAAPAVLVFGGGAGALVVPQSGDVNQ